MGFWSEGRLASTNHRFPHCDLVLQHIPCHRTPAPNNLPGFNSFKGPAIKSHNGLGSRLAKQIAKGHFGNKIDFQTLSPLSDRGIYIRKSFPKVSAFQPLKAFPIHCEVTMSTSVKKRNRSLFQCCTPTWR